MDHLVLVAGADEIAVGAADQGVEDAEGRFVFASAACERIFGYTQAEMVGRVMIEYGVTFVVPENRRINQDILVPPEPGAPYQPGQVVMRRCGGLIAGSQGSSLRLVKRMTQA